MHALRNDISAKSIAPDWITHTERKIVYIRKRMRMATLLCDGNPSIQHAGYRSSRRRRRHQSWTFTAKPGCGGGFRR